MRFPGFEGEWKTKKLGEVSSVSSGGTPSRANPLYWNGDIPWISTTLIDFNFIEKSEEYITQEGLENSSAKLFPIGTLLMAMYGQGKTRGKVAILNIEATTNQACGAIITNKEVVNPFFAFQNLVKRYDEIRDLSNQGSQENLSGGIIKRIEITFPKLLEQIKIASFLSLIDERIQTQNKIIERLETLIKGLSEKIFSQKIRFKEFTDEWKVKSLGEMGNTFNGLSGKTKEDFGKGIPYIQYKQIFDSAKVQIKKCGLVEIAQNENQNSVKYGDIFFTISSETPDEIGMSSVLLDEVNEMYLNSFCFGYRPFSLQVLNPLFASYLFRSSVFRNEIVKLAQGSTRYNMSKIGLMKLTISLPSSKEQITIARFLSSIDQKLQTEKNFLDKYQSKKQFLLQNLFI
ncbi:restriction endonuclease subunit S [Elizabethkingia miricola]|uniref:restriction endonuclease subunit S n=3 Tax=Elizabethkingia miricola TaxID=172045 RepID=UPI000B34FA4E|nr:restriction endonuclease subunit S [Elizabethkingia miricola]